MAEKQFNKDEVIFRKNDPAESFFIIKKGTVSIVDIDEDNMEQTLAKLGEGEYFGEMAVIEGYPRSTSAIAFEDGTIVDEISEKELGSYFSQNPDAILELMKNLSERLRDLTKDYVEAEDLLSDLGLEEKKEHKGLVKKLAELFKGKNYKAMQPSAESQRQLKDGYAKKVVEYPAGTIICKEGETGNCMYAIHGGEVGIYSGYGTDHEKLITTLFPDKFFGEMGMLQGEPRSATAVALVNTVIEIIYPEDLNELFQKNPSKVVMMMAHLSNRLRNLTNSYVEIGGYAKTLAELDNFDDETEKELQEKIKDFEARLYE